MGSNPVIREDDVITKIWNISKVQTYKTLHSTSCGKVDKDRVRLINI